jgi:hypothetical protein
MTTVPKKLCRNVQESTFDGHKDDVSYNLYFSSAGISLLRFLCHISQVCRSCMSAAALLPVHDVIVRNCNVGRLNFTPRQSVTFLSKL